MSVRAAKETRGIRVKLPATSANLGPGFDAVGLALSMHLTVEAHVAPAWQIRATGRDAALCGALDRNLIIETYRDVVERAGWDAPEALRLSIHNEIPLGAGCGSSAAAILAGVALAEHFAGRSFSDSWTVSEASRVEGHPDNVAACWFGGFTVSSMSDAGVQTATFEERPQWQMLLAVQPASLATKTARALLPDSYSKADTIFNVQRAALLTAAFAQGRLELMREATRDRMHQPFRQDACPLLKTLLPLADDPAFAAVTLSGAGPSVLLFLGEGTTLLEAETRVGSLVGEEVELMPVSIAGAAERTVLSA